MARDVIYKDARIEASAYTPLHVYTDQASLFYAYCIIEHEVVIYHQFGLSGYKFRQWGGCKILKVRMLQRLFSDTKGGAKCS